MASTTFSGPVTSTNGFIGAVAGPVEATTLTTTGVVIMTGLPTSNPLVVGQLWNNAGVLTVSAG